MIDSQVKRGSAELAILSVLSLGAMHGYEIARRIQQQTDGTLQFTLASLYPLLYRLEKRGWIKGKWESVGERRRRCYQITASGLKRLKPLRAEWAQLFTAIAALSRGADA